MSGRGRNRWVCKGKMYRNPDTSSYAYDKHKAARVQHLPIFLSSHKTSPNASIAGRAVCQQSSATHVCLLLQVHVVELQLSREEALRRHQAAAAAEAAGLEVVGLGAEASQSLLGEASFMPQPQQPEDQVGLLTCLHI
jgi:hypothetical protein